MVRENNRSVELAFSSEEPAIQPWGIEVLSHDQEAVRMKRAGMRDGLPMLLDHDRTKLIGRLRNVRLCSDDEDKKRRARGTASFGNSALASETWQDVVDGIRTDVSVGYRIFYVKEMSTKEMTPDLVELAAREKLPVYRVTDWEPFECSLVATPADPTVGVGRTAAETEEQEGQVMTPPAVEEAKIEEKDIPKEERKMSEDTKKTNSPASDFQLVNYEKDVSEQRDKAAKDATERERLRVQGINDIYEKFKTHIPEFMRRKAVEEGMNLQDFQDVVLKRLGTGEPINTPLTEIGLSPQEIRRYSFTRAILSQWKEAKVDCSFELACSKEVQKRLGIDGRGGIFIPYDTVKKPAHPAGTGVRTDLSIVGGDTVGGYLVGTDHLGSEFIDVLRNAMVSRRAGARVLSGLRGNVAIPKRTAGAATYWPTEGNAPTEDTATTFGQLLLSPNTIAANVDYTRNLLIQSNPSVDALVTGDIALALATGIDLAVFHGTGTEQPQGIVGTSGVGSTTATSVTFAKMLDFQTDLAAANALAAGCAYVTTPAVAAILAAVPKFTYATTALWNGSILESSDVCGFRGFATNQITAGYCIFGDFSQVIIGEWGALELVVDPYTQSKTGIIQVTAFQSVDVGLRYPAAFSVSTSVTAP